MSELVYLKCVKEGSKLRIKIISPGFFNEANCQFPKDIRVEGRKYSVPHHAVSFAEGPNHKFFYRISKSYIKIVNSSITASISSNPVLPDKIFEDNTTLECIICMSSNKEIVFAKCGHYTCCEQCSITIFNTTKKCPICRSKIDSVVKREQIQL
jgi:hypothetical protein